MLYYINGKEIYDTSKSVRNVVFSRLSSRTLNENMVIGLFANEETEVVTSVFSLINNICH